MASQASALRTVRKVQRIKAFFFLFVFALTGGIYPLVWCIIWGLLLAILQMKSISASLSGTVKYLFTPEGYEVEGASEGLVAVFKANGVLGMIVNVLFIFTGAGICFAISSLIAGALIWLFNKETGRHILGNCLRGFTLGSNKWVAKAAPAEAASAE